MVREDTKIWISRIQGAGRYGDTKTCSEENRVTAKGFKHVVKKDTRSAGKKWFKVYRAKEIRGYRYVV